MANPEPQKNGGKPDKLIRDALKAAARQDPTTLKRAVEAIWDKACNGDVPAFKEIADRIDGKVAQAIVGDSEYDPILTQDYNARLIELARKAGIDVASTQEALAEDGK